MIKAAIFKIGRKFILSKAHEIEKEAVEGGWKPLNTFLYFFGQGNLYQEKEQARSRGSGRAGSSPSKNFQT